MKYNLVQLGDMANLTAVIDGEMYVASQDHPSWHLILQKVLDDDESVVNIFNPIKEVSKRFTAISDRVSVKDNRVFFDGDPVDNALTQHIIAAMNADEDFLSLVNFYEKLATNPQVESREQFYRWIQATGGLTITPDGDVVAYKGVKRIVTADDEKSEFEFQSINSGTAIVNGVVKTGQIPQSIGSIVEMPRSEVTFDPDTSCSTGLHAGTYEYAKTYGNVVLKVVINPRDVVSVPTDASNQKVRVCRYVNLEETGAEVKAPVYTVAGYSEVMDAGDVEPESDECGFCGSEYCEDEECATNDWYDNNYDD